MTQFTCNSLKAAESETCYEVLIFGRITRQENVHGHLAVSVRQFDDLCSWIFCVLKASRLLHHSYLETLAACRSKLAVLLSGLETEGLEPGALEVDSVGY